MSLGVKWNPEVQLGHVLQLAGGLFIGTGVIFGIYLGIVRDESATSERLTQQDGKILLVSQRLDALERRAEQDRKEIRDTLEKISGRVEEVRGIAIRLDAQSTHR